MHPDRVIEKPQSVKADSVGTKLLADVGHLYQGHDPQATKRLHDAGVLPDPKIFDPTKVSTHLKADREAEATLKTLRTKNESTQGSLEYGRRIDGEVKDDFNKILKVAAPGTTELTKTSIERLKDNGDAPKETRDAATRLLGNWDKDSALLSDDKKSISKDSIEKGTKQNEETRKEPEEKLKATKKQEDDLAADQKKREERIKLEEKALSPSAQADELSRVPNGKGYDAVARHLLTLAGGHHSESEVKALRNILREQFKEDNKGRDPNILSHKDHLVTKENFGKIMDKVNALVQHEQPK
jgi:hypothetical protein